MKEMKNKKKRKTFIQEDKKFLFGGIGLGWEKNRSNVAISNDVYFLPPLSLSLFLKVSVLFFF